LGLEFGQAFSGVFDLRKDGVAVIQTFRARINFHPYLHFLVTEGGVDEAGAFRRLNSFDDARLAALFARGVLGFLVRSFIEYLLAP
jgi:hypothetical protein